MMKDKNQEVLKILCRAKQNYQFDTQFMNHGKSYSSFSNCLCSKNPQEPSD